MSLLSCGFLNLSLTIKKGVRHHVNFSHGA
jgi:hypothetical protein